jgi:hypothetical protein
MKAQNEKNYGNFESFDARNRIFDGNRNHSFEVFGAQRRRNGNYLNLIVRNVWHGINRQFGDIINPNDEQKRDSY